MCHTAGTTHFLPPAEPSTRAYPNVQPCNTWLLFPQGKILAVVCTDRDQPTHRPLAAIVNERSLPILPPALDRPWALPAWAAPAITAACIALWVLLAGAVNTGQFGDNIEEFVWAQGFETGYWKHPPLPTWMLRAVIQTLGFWSGWTYVLAAICFAGAAFFTWRIAQRLGGERVAGIAVLLQGLHLGFSWRAQEYNHNTVLVLFSAMTVWAVMRALDSLRTGDWMLAGLCGGLAMLAKYQAVLMLSGILIALALIGALRHPRVRHGLLWATAMGLLVLSPHVAGLLAGHTASIAYAIDNFQHLSLGASAQAVVAHLVNQLRFHAPMLLAIGVAAMAGQGAGEGPAWRSSGPSARVLARDPVRAWLIGLVAWPIVFMMLMPLASGMRLQAQWGLPAFQFLVLYLALRLARAMPGLAVASLMRAVLVVQLFNAILFTWVTFNHKPTGSRVDRAYPARELSEAVLKDWKRVTNCPLQYVAGPTFEAGIVSVYSGSHPQVLEMNDFTKSPWIDPDAMRHAGSVVLSPQSDEGPLDHSMRVPARGKQSTHRLSWVIVPPEVECAWPPVAAHAAR